MESLSLAKMRQSPFSTQIVPKKRDTTQHDKYKKAF